MFDVMCVMCLGGERESTGIALAHTHCPLDSDSEVSSYLL